MGVSYKKLWILLAENEMQPAGLRKQANIAPNTFTKLKKNQYVTMPILNSICDTLNVDYGDIMEHISNKES